jgi:hypothetical protein
MLPANFGLALWYICTTFAPQLMLDLVYTTSIQPGHTELTFGTHWLRQTQEYPEGNGNRGGIVTDFEEILENGLEPIPTKLTKCSKQRPRSGQKGHWQ